MHNPHLFPTEPNTQIIKQERNTLADIPLVVSSDSHGARTHDPNIKSVVLYQLS